MLEAEEFPAVGLNSKLSKVEKEYFFCILFNDEYFRQYYHRNDKSEYKHSSFFFRLFATIIFY